MCSLNNIIINRNKFNHRKIKFLFIYFLFIIILLFDKCICINIKENLITKRHNQTNIYNNNYSKYTIDDLLTTNFPNIVSNDIDMDPCKAGGFMGDIALPNVNYDNEWKSKKFNKTFQQELEKLKQEVYNEGLQVEEEGLTDIIRRKTKQPVNLDGGGNAGKINKNDATITNESVLNIKMSKDSLRNGKSVINRQQQMASDDNSSNSSKENDENLSSSHTQSQVNATIIDNNHHYQSNRDMETLSSTLSPVKLTTNDDSANTLKLIENVTEVTSTQSTILKIIPLARNIPTVVSLSDNIKNNNKNNNSSTRSSTNETRITTQITNGSVLRNIDQNKIQSDSKDIIDNTGVNLVNSLNKKLIIITETESPLSRTTLPKRFSNSGGNGGTLEDVQTLTVDGTIKKRHRHRRQGRKIQQNINTNKTSDYEIKLQRLKDELNRPVLTISDFKAKLKTQQENKKNFHQIATTTLSTIKIYENNENILQTTESSWINSNETSTLIEIINNRNGTEEDDIINDDDGIEDGVDDDTNDSDLADIISKKRVTLDTVNLELSTMENLSMVGRDENNNENNRMKGITEHHHRVTRAATAKKDRIWDFGVIPYEIDGNFSGAHKALFKQAMRHWENYTCIKFVERNPQEHPNYILFTERPCGCCSFVGKRGNGAQAISIGKNCDKFGIVVHELGHVVGFWHEHTRPDRENHVTIEKTNIMSGQEYNFNKLTDEEVNSLGLPYDYDSIMHYARNTFSKGTYLDTILPIEVKGKKRPEIGQRLRLSEGDIAQANLLYKCAKCGKTFQDNSGTFNSPSYYATVPPTEPERCEWRITATHGERIVLNITELDVFKSNNCRSDYLEIRDGYWYKSPVLGRYCGMGRVNELIKTTGSRMLLTFMTSHRQSGHKGFSANYEAVCGGELDLDSGGRLESPNYPLDYLPNKECIWKLTVPKDYQVALKFQSFEVENHDNCVYDYVEVRDGDTADSRLIGVFCGYKVPSDIRSTSNKLFVKFVSDGSVQKAGFSATFMKEVDECEQLDHGCQHECINTLGGYECACSIGYELHSDKKSCENACGGKMDTANGTITSPSFPDLYPVSKYCVWEIIAPPQYRITLNFTHFDLEGNHVYQQECDYDSLTVFSKMGEDNYKRHGIYCGNRLPPMVTSEGNALRIVFSSDNTIQQSGFAAVFFTDIDECAINNGGCQHECRNTIGSYVCSCHNGFTLHDNEHDCKEGGCKYEITATQGQIFSPNYPDYYPPKKDCVWHFTTTPGHRIRLTFNDFEMEPHQECTYDHIAIYDGDSPDSYTLGRFCGSKIPHPISATSNEMFMVFKSDTSVQRKGFFATHSTACGGHLTATNRAEHFYSHSKYGDHNYDNRADCDWTIEAEPGRNVQLSFLTFEIEDEPSCSYDYVEVYGGLDDSSAPLYGKFCGNAKPPDIISMHEALLVRFRTDDTIFLKGFSASYVAVDPFESEEMSSDSSEMTPFPGSLKSIYKSNLDEEDEDEDDDDEDDNNYKNNKIKYNKRGLK